MYSNAHAVLAQCLLEAFGLLPGLLAEFLSEAPLWGALLGSLERLMAGGGTPAGAAASQVGGLPLAGWRLTGACRAG